MELYLVFYDDMNCFSIFLFRMSNIEYNPFMDEELFDQAESSTANFDGPISKNHSHDSLNTDSL